MPSLFSQETIQLSLHLQTQHYSRISLEDMLAEVCALYQVGERVHDSINRTVQSPLKLKPTLLNQCSFASAGSSCSGLRIPQSGSKHQRCNPLPLCVRCLGMALCNPLESTLCIVNWGLGYGIADAHKEGPNSRLTQRDGRKKLIY